MEMMFLVLVTVHLLADYPLQGEFLANMKGSNLFLLFVHSGIWAGMITIAASTFVPVSVFDYLCLLVVHMAIDQWKCSRKDKTKALTTHLYIDQFMHLLQICALIYVKMF